MHSRRSLARIAIFGRYTSGPNVYVENRSSTETVTFTLKLARVTGLLPLRGKFTTTDTIPPRRAQLAAATVQRSPATHSPDRARLSQ